MPTQQAIKCFCNTRIVHGRGEIVKAVGEFIGRAPGPVYQWLMETPLIIIAWDDFNDGFAGKCLIPAYRQLPLCDCDVPLHIVGIPTEMLSNDWCESGALLGLLAHEVAHIYIATHNLFEAPADDETKLFWGSDPDEEELTNNIARSWGFCSELDALDRKYEEMARLDEV